MATDFYLTLPSNASMKVHPDNTLAHYITDLPQRISLSGEWECGMAEIQYPHTVAPRYNAPRYYANSDITRSVVDPDFPPPGENAKWACLNLLRIALTILKNH